MNSSISSIIHIFSLHAFFCVDQSVSMSKLFGHDFVTIWDKHISINIPLDVNNLYEFTSYHEYTVQ